MLSAPIHLIVSAALIMNVLLPFVMAMDASLTVLFNKLLEPIIILAIAPMTLNVILNFVILIHASRHV